MSLRTLLRGLTVAIALSLPQSYIFAFCAQEGPYYLYQCGRSWFAPPPAGSGNVSLQWWALGYGNANVVHSSNSANDGSAFVPTPLPGSFIGNDSGLLPATGGLVNASQFGGPAGSLCFDFLYNWGSTVVDGCGDVNRNAMSGGGSLGLSDNYLNIYWDKAYGPGYYYRSSLVDSPMGALLKESNNLSFALAFFATIYRNQDPNDFSPGDFNAGAIQNGDTGPTGNNVIPWQAIPQPVLETTQSDPNNPISTFDVTASWALPRFVHDGSTRPCMLMDGVTPCPSVPGGGVGVLDQGALIHFEVEIAPLLGPGSCGTTWTTVAGSRVDYPATQTVALNVPRNSCVRLRTGFGRTPLQAFRSGATVANRDANRLDAQTAKLGDLGYSVISGVAVLACGTWVDSDLDGQSECSGDCDDARSSVYSGAIQACGDGLNNDCRDALWPALVGTNEFDDDDDGVSECDGDCMDGNVAIHPGASQTCDGANNDCSAQGWPSLVDTNEFDDDADSFTECGGDCADGSASVFPGAAQMCDGANNNCSDGSWPAVPANEADGDADSWRICQGDCNDASAAVHPGALETCNSIDDNCSGTVDEDSTGIDSDGDGVHNACDNCRLNFNPSQADTDKDGPGNSCDNCVAIYNPSQADTDSDQRGDSCDNCQTEYNPFQDDSDLDKVGDVCDNCIFDSNVDQADLDQDLEGDTCDLDDGLILIELLAPTAISYQEEQAFASFNIYRGDLSVLQSVHIYTQDQFSIPGAAQYCGETGGSLFDGDPLAAGGIAFYLVTGLTSGGEGSLGMNSAGDERPNDNPCP